MKGHVSVINTLLQKGENVDAVTNVSSNNFYILKPNFCFKRIGLETKIMEDYVLIISSLSPGKLYSITFGCRSR